MRLMLHLQDDNSWADYLAERLDPTPSPYKGEPVKWVNEVTHEFVTSDQANIMGSVVTNRYTAVQSCHDTGKSWTASRIAAWWLDSHPAGEAFVVTTAPTAAQVSTVLWREIGKAHRQGQLFGYITGDNQWKIDHPGSAPEIVAYGRKPADYNPAGFSGIHARYVLVIIDEACGVPKALYEAVDSLATNKNARVLAIGNPDDPSSYFAKVCAPGSGWVVMRLDALTQATFTREEVAKYPAVLAYMIESGIPPSTEFIPEALKEMLVDPLWVDERIRMWGVDSPVFASKVRGLFPNVTNDTLIHPHLVVLAQARETEPRPMMSRMGVDVARYGVDHTIILLRQGQHSRVVQDIPYGPTTQTAGLIQLEGQKFVDRGIVQPPANVDDAGVGGGVVDILVANNYPVVQIQPGGGSEQKMKNGKSRFFDRRSELLWNVREALAGPSQTGEDGWLDLDPLDAEMFAQLTNIKYRVNEHGQIRVESKDAMKARGLPSPDRADALSYSIAPDEPIWRAAEDSMITGGLLAERW